MNVDEILRIDTKAFESNYNDYQNWKSITPLQAKEAIREIVMQTIQMCAENAKTIQDKDSFYQSYTIVDKESILKTIEQIKL